MKRLGRQPRSRRACFAGLALLCLGCLEVQKVDPGPFVIDDFEDDDLQPRSDLFTGWTCDTARSEGPDGGSSSDPDAAPPAAPDGGSTVNCAPDPGGDNSCCALAAEFDLQANALGQHDDARVFTEAKQPVNFNRFRTFVFSGILESRSPLQGTTQLFVELGCSKVQPPGTPSASQAVGFSVGSEWTSSRLGLSMFSQAMSSTNQDCLARVDSVRFIVRPGRGSQAASGTLHIDNVYLLE